MKLFSIIVLVALCAAAVTPAPPSTPKFSFEQYLLSAALNKVAEKTQDFLGKLECIRDAIGKVIIESDVKDVWDQAKSKLDDLVNVEWEKCNKIDDISDQAKCRAVVVQEGVETITEFIKNLITQAKLGLVNQIKEEVVSQCFTKNAVFLETTVPEQFECFVDVLGDVSKRNGLEDLWANSEPLLRERLNNWKQCPNAGNKFLVLLCNLREGFSSFRIFNDYIKLVAEKKPEVVPIFAREIQQNCNAQDLKIVPEFVSKTVKDVNDIIEKVKCYNEAISDAVAETEFSKIWEEYKDELAKLIDNVKGCQGESNIWQQVKCIVKESRAIQEVFEKFYAKLKEANVETYDRVKKYIKDRCYSKKYLQ